MQVQELFVSLSLLSHTHTHCRHSYVVQPPAARCRVCLERKKFFRVAYWTKNILNKTFILQLQCKINSWCAYKFTKHMKKHFVLVKLTQINSFGQFGRWSIRPIYVLLGPESKLRNSVPGKPGYRPLRSYIRFIVIYNRHTLVFNKTENLNAGETLYFGQY